VILVLAVIFSIWKANQVEAQRESLDG